MNHIIIEDFYDLGMNILKIVSHYEIWAILLLILLVKVYKKVGSPRDLLKQLKIYMKLRHVLNKGSTSQHKATLLAKYFMKVPIREKENEL